jgi:hypothetical protein
MRRGMMIVLATGICAAHLDGACDVSRETRRWSDGSALE